MSVDQENTSNDPEHGWVIYTDGSYRSERCGWGFHGYHYIDRPLKKGIGISQLPTKLGYLAPEGSVKDGLAEAVTPLTYVDSFGSLDSKATNNIAEISAVIHAIRFADTQNAQRLYILTDSEYVHKGITRWIKTWKKKNWLKKDGDPVNNIAYWKTLDDLWEAWQEHPEKKIDLVWVKGHSGNVGNDLADFNAVTGGCWSAEHKTVISDPEGYHNPKGDKTPLIIKHRMLFNVGDRQSPGEPNVYYTYSLGRHQNYGHKQDDSKRQRVEKTDLLLGRRISDATFCIAKMKEPINYIDQLIQFHRERHERDIIDLAVLRLDTAFSPKIMQRIDRYGQDMLFDPYNNLALITANDEVISKTLQPPRMAYEAVDMFGVLRELFDKIENDEIPKNIQRLDLTKRFYEEDKKGKTVLHKEIKQSTLSVDVEVTFEGQKIKLRPLLGIDLPTRNGLARIADMDPSIHVFIHPVSDKAYKVSYWVTCNEGMALYQCPYVQFVLK